MVALEKRFLEGSKNIIMEGATPDGALGSEENITTELLYAPLSADLHVSHSREATNELAPMSLGLLLPAVDGSTLPSDEVLHSRVRNRTLLLDKETSCEAEKSKRASKRPRWATEEKGTGRRPKVSKAAIKRARSSKVVVPCDQRRYEIYEPLARMWQDYAKQVLGDGNLSQAGDRLLRMDLHGACVEVSRSLDPGLVGVAGILIVETANTVLVITRRNKLITVSKTCTFLRFAVGDSHSFELALPLVPFRASERSARKVKKRHMSLF